MSMSAVDDVIVYMAQLIKQCDSWPAFLYLPIPFYLRQSYLSTDISINLSSEMMNI